MSNLAQLTSYVINLGVVIVSKEAMLHIFRRLVLSADLRRSILHHEDLKFDLTLFCNVIKQCEITHMFHAILAFFADLN